VKELAFGAEMRNGERRNIDSNFLARIQSHKEWTKALSLIVEVSLKMRKDDRKRKRTKRTRAVELRILPLLLKLFSCHRTIFAS
jgi:hypothetical protein